MKTFTDLKSIRNVAFFREIKSNIYLSLVFSNLNTHETKQTVLNKLIIASDSSHYKTGAIAFQGMTRLLHECIIFWFYKNLNIQ